MWQVKHKTYQCLKCYCPYSTLAVVGHFLNPVKLLNKAWNTDSSKPGMCELFYWMYRF